MTSMARVPPGRAGRLWVRRRLGMAERGLDLLDRKLRILRAEHERLSREAARTREEWTTACAEAQTWLLRAALLAGRESLRPAEPARVAVEWTYAMGTRYPNRADLALPPPPDALPASAALVVARASAGIALEAAVRHAVALEAARVLDREVTATRQRIRALKDRWIPRLTETAAAIDLALDEMERSDAARLLRARQERPAGPSA